MTPQLRLVLNLDMFDTLWQEKNSHFQIVKPIAYSLVKGRYIGAELYPHFMKFTFDILYFLDHFQF